jgi:hypothetical protein
MASELLTAPKRCSGTRSSLVTRELKRLSYDWIPPGRVGSHRLSAGGHGYPACWLYDGLAERSAAATSPGTLTPSSWAFNDQSRLSAQIASPDRRCLPSLPSYPTEPLQARPALIDPSIEPGGVRPGRYLHLDRHAQALWIPGVVLRPRTSRPHPSRFCSTAINSLRRRVCQPRPDRKVIRFTGS